ncbi:MAG: enoyl-CoA hydratase/isomerase family protein [Pseudomonadota bacterium]
MTGTVQVEQRGNVLLATIANPPYALMDRDIVVELFKLVARADSDPTVGGVVLTGAHPTRFLAHFDVRLILGSAESSPRIGPQALRRAMTAISAAVKVPKAGALLERSPAAGLLAMMRMHGLMKAIQSSSAVWIAALNGDTGGGGCELSLACDQRFMADGDFFIAQPEIFLGFPPGAGGTQRLTRLLGASKALRICLGGEPMTPHEAMELGLIDRVVAPKALLDEAIAEAARLGKRPKHAIGAVKRAIHQGGSTTLDEGLRIEASEFLAAIGTPDSIAAQKAYVKRTKELGDLPVSDRALIKKVIQNGKFF